ncbi:MAG: LysR family transcriptional regulator [Selenomonadaceae bacterium]|nr:LysR family transcriptional regulator [Selenomonadaceae bacterium]
MLLKQLQYFMVVAECRHFTNAAKQLYVTQSALSQQINKLESDLGIKLINRISHPIELTEAGNEFYIGAKKILADVEELQAGMSRWHSAKCSTLKLGIISGLGRIKIAEWLSEFNTQYENVQFSLVNHLSKELCRRLNEGSLNLAICASSPSFNVAYDFETRLLEREPFLAILPTNHPMAGEDKFDLSKAANEKYIFPTEDNLSHDIFLEECKKAGFSPNVISYTNRPGRRIELVKAGLGISLISKSGLSFYNSGEGAVAKELVTPFYKEIVMARKKRESYSFIENSLWNFIEAKMNCTQKHG